MLLKRAWFLWCYFCGTLGAVVLFVIPLLLMEHSHKEAAYVQDELVPLANFVEQFRDQNHRLPTQSEFKEWANQDKQHHWMVSYYPAKPDFVTDWGKDDYDFLVGQWRGEANEYYRSWDHQTFDDYSNPHAPLN
jgi:hypothetical protein